MARYGFESLKEGYNMVPDGEEVFYISNPALGLWACKERFEYWSRLPAQPGSVKLAGITADDRNFLFFVAIGSIKYRIK